MQTRLPFAATAGIAALLVLAACSGPAGAGSTSASASQSATESATASASSSEAATTTYQVKVAHTTAGNALVGEDGKTLYFFAKDANGTISCTGSSLTSGSTGTITVTVSNIVTNRLGGDLHFRMYKIQSGRLIEIGNGTGIGGLGTQSASAAVSAGDQILVWVYGFNYVQGAYVLGASIA